MQVSARDHVDVLGSLRLDVAAWSLVVIAEKVLAGAGEQGEVEKFVTGKGVAEKTANGESCCGEGRCCRCGGDTAELFITHFANRQHPQSWWGTGADGT